MPRAAEQDVLSRPFWVVGHRGSPMVEVENTLPSFERALGEGANALELDLNVTRDGEVILWHDYDPHELRARIRRWGLEPSVPYRPVLSADARRWKPTSELSLSDVRRYLGYAEKRSGRRVEVLIPTLAEFMEWAVGKEQLGLVFLDVKLPARAAALAGKLLARLDAIVERLEPRFRIVLESCEPAVVRELVRLGARYEHALDVEPHPGIVFSVRSASAARRAIEHRLRHATPQKPRSITLWPFTTHRRIVQADLRLMREHNERSPEAKLDSLVCFTINEEPEMRELIALGVSGIQSDYPGRLYRVALASGCRVAYARTSKVPAFSS